MKPRLGCRVALAVVATVALIFLIGEKLSDYWRGFIAGLIYLSFCGTFSSLARIVMPEPLVTTDARSWPGRCSAEYAAMSEGAIGRCGSPVSGFLLR